MNRAAGELAVVVLNWNGGDDSIACLESLRASTVPSYVIVVDNDSTDDSVRRIEATGLADEIISAGANLGYAGGNNVGLQRAIELEASAVAVLNNDTVVEPDALGRLLGCLHPSEHRALSPDIRYLDRPAESWFAGGIVERGWPRHLQASELGEATALRPSECLSGCCIVARRETWQHVGLFDDDYFLVFEDSDWSLRATARGVMLSVVTASRIRHRVSSSFAAGPSSLLASYYFIRNGLRFEARYFRRYLAEFVFRWLIRPAPGLVRAGRGSELCFRWLGMAAFAAGQRGPAPRIVQRLAERLR